MKKRIAKTIILIVFVVFLGINCVNAAPSIKQPPGGDAPVSTSNSNSATYGSDIGRLEEEAETNGLVSCGSVTDIPKIIPSTTKIVYLVIEILVPIALVILGMIDLAKGVMAQKEDEIKKGQQTFIKRIIAAAIMFFVLAIVKLFASFLADDSSVGECLNCFIKGECVEESLLDEEETTSDEPQTVYLDNVVEGEALI